MTVLVVAAHPDDEVLGAGGTIRRIAEEGDEVFVLILGEGAASRPGDETSTAAGIALLREQATAAGRVLGTTDVLFEGLPDNRFDSVDLLDIVRLVEGHIRAVRPVTVLTHHPGDVNIDHRRTFDAVLAATRPQPGSTIMSVRSFEVASSTDWAFDAIVPFRPDTFYDISGTLGSKLDALSLYDGELRPFPHARSIGAVEHAARRWGSVVGVDAAEPFETVWERR